MSSTDLEPKIFLLLDGDLPHEEARELESELLSDPAALAVYRKCVKLHGALETRLIPKAALETSGVVPVERLVSLQRKRIVRLSWVSATAAMIVAAILLLRFVIPEAPASVLTFESSPNTTLSLTHAGGKVEEGVLVEGSQMILEEGTVEFEFETGVRAVLKAPCDLTVLGKNHLQVDQGTIWFRVPEEGRGFAVTTPGLEVVDLGTEFGVIVSQAMQDEVHVFEGEVEVTLRGEGGSSERLTASQARKMAKKRELVAHVPDLTKFRTRLQQRPSLAEASIMAYYPFDSDFADASGNGNDLRVAEGTPSITTRRGERVFGGGALNLKSTAETAEYLSLRFPITFAPTDAWSVSFWSRNRPRTGERSGMIVGDLTKADFIWTPGDGAVNGGLRFRNSQGSSADYGDIEEDHRFHHWVVIADGSGKVTVYRDNVSLGAMAFSTAFEITSVGHAFNMNHQSMNGQIDELYIFDEAINATTVYDLFKGASEKRSASLNDRR